MKYRQAWEHGLRLLDIFKRRAPETSVRFEVTGSPASSFSTFSGDPYSVDVFRSGVDAIARVAGKFVLTPTAHFRDGTTTTCDPRLARVLQVQPNPYMSTYDFQYQFTTLLYVHNNAYAFIERDATGHVIGLWPLHVLQCEYLTGKDGTLWCAFRFKNGRSACIAYEDVVHLRRHFNGGDINGESPDAITPALELAHAQNAEAVRQIRDSGTIRAIVRTPISLAPEKRKEMADLFANTWLTNENISGVIASDSSADVELIDPKTVTISTDDQAATAKKVLDSLGISASIVNSSFTDDEFSAFEESVIESLALQMSLEFSRKIYPTGNRTIEVSTSRISYMSVESKVKLFKEGLPAGVLSINEARSMLGLSPIENDYRLQSLNYVDATIASEYQLYRAGTSGIKAMGGTDGD